jgi:hypothetical protein
MTTDNTGPKQLTPWQPGQSGNPSGRPKGSRNRTTLAAEALLDGEAEELTRKAIELAKGGDLAAIRICLDRILPTRKDRTITFALPTMETASDAANAVAAIVAAVAEGEVTPAEAVELSKLVENYSKTLVATDIEGRIAKLEKTMGK